MSHPDLTSHHVNYLIWRYLQESGHGDAAVLLQRAWNHDPQSLPFAPYIRTHALVSLVQKGLQYHELEQSFDKEGTPISYTPDSYFFGPPSLDPSSPTRPSISAVPLDAASAADRRRQSSVSPAAGKVGTRDPVATNGHLPSDGNLPTTSTTGSGKKARRGDRTTAEPPAKGDGMDIDSNGTFTGQHESPSVTAPAAPDADVDGDGDVSMGAAATAATTTTTTRSESQGHEPSGPKSSATTTAAATPTPPTTTTATTTTTTTNLQPPPPPPLPPTLITGHSVGVQISPAKAADLSPDTVVLDVSQDDHVTRTLWRPHDPTVVVAAGDTFCSLWRLSSSASPAPEKLVESSGDNTCVSAVAWNPTGHKLAVATYNDMRGSITMYDVQGNAVDLLPEVPRMITGLHWSQSHSSHLVVVASDSRQSELALWDDSLRPEEFPAPQVVDGSIYDLSWLGHSQAFACGDGSVYQCQIDSSIHITKTYTSEDSDSTTWTFIRSADYGQPSKQTPLAVAASSAKASFWIPTHDMRQENAHQGDITAIELRAPAQSPAILASCSTDDTVKVWHIDPDAKRIDCIHRLYLGPSVPALVGTFSPDGYALAAGSKDNLYIWNAERGGAPLATWKVPRKTAKEESDQPVNGKAGTPEPLPDRSLSWDTDGKRLAFGVGHQMAIVNLQR